MRHVSAFAAAALLLSGFAPRLSAQNFVADLSSDAPSEDVVDFDEFAEILEPHGRWIDVPEYGLCWQPRVSSASPEWAPYTLGSWVYTNAGWTWVSEEPFGGVVYHYGRWFLTKRGWCWVPGQEWGPAWVSWRTNSNYIGWAPLPPEVRWDYRRGIGSWVDVQSDIGPGCYRFCSVRQFSAPRMQTVVVPVSRNATILITTENVTSIRRHDHFVHCGGPDYHWVNERCSRPVTALQLVLSPSVGAFFSLGFSSSRPQAISNNALHLPAPSRIHQPQAQRFTNPPVTVNVQATRGWSANRDADRKFSNHVSQEWERNRVNPTPEKPVTQVNLPPAVVLRSSANPTAPGTASGLLPSGVDRPSRVSPTDSAFTPPKPDSLSGPKNPSGGVPSVVQDLPADAPLNGQLPSKRPGAPASNSLSSPSGQPPRSEPFDARSSQKPTQPLPAPYPLKPSTVAPSQVVPSATKPTTGKPSGFVDSSFPDSAAPKVQRTAIPQSPTIPSSPSPFPKQPTTSPNEPPTLRSVETVPSSRSPQNTRFPQTGARPEMTSPGAAAGNASPQGTISGPRFPQSSRDSIAPSNRSFGGARDSSERASSGRSPAPVYPAPTIQRSVPPNPSPAGISSNPGGSMPSGFSSRPAPSVGGASAVTPSPFPRTPGNVPSGIPQSGGAFSSPSRPAPSAPASSGASSSSPTSSSAGSGGSKKPSSSTDKKDEKK